MTTINTTHGTHTPDFDAQGINRMICGIQLEMGADPAVSKPKVDVLHLGGPQLTALDLDALSRFSLSKNWNTLFCSFDTANPEAGPSDIHLTATDGETVSTTLSGGRLWKRDAKSRSVLVFPAARCLATYSNNGRLLLGDMKGKYHQRGFELARTSLAERVAGRQDCNAAIFPIDTFAAVMDMRTMLLMWKMG